MKTTIYANLVDNFTISFMDYPDPEREAINIFFCGCDNHCIDCSNPQLQNYNYQEGTKIYYTHTFIDKIIHICNLLNIKSINLLGGDPLAKINREFTEIVTKELSKAYDICIYTGYNVDQVKEFDIQGFTFIKCGTYSKELAQPSDKTDDYMQFASTNQILYDKNLNQISENGKYYFNEVIK